jgi:hypothetical protein
VLGGTGQPSEFPQQVTAPAADTAQLPPPADTEIHPLVRRVSDTRPLVSSLQQVTAPASDSAHVCRELADTVGRYHRSRRQ